MACTELEEGHDLSCYARCRVKNTYFSGTCHYNVGMNENCPPRSGKIPYSIILIAAIAAGLGLWLGQSMFSGSPELPPVQTMRLLDSPRAIADFSLDTAQGAALDNAGLHGHYTLVFLGFTHCPDVCPMTLADLAKAEKLWADLAETQRPRILFISVDPERDAPPAIAKYAAYFSPTILTGTSDIESLNLLAASMSMVFAKTPLEGDNYTVDHTSWVAVLNPQAQLVGFIPPPLDPTGIAADMKLLVKSR